MLLHVHLSTYLTTRLHRNCMVWSTFQLDSHKPRFFVVVKNAEKLIGVCAEMSMLNVRRLLNLHNNSDHQVGDDVLTVVAAAALTIFFCCSKGKVITWDKTPSIMSSMYKTGLNKGQVFHVFLCILKLNWRIKVSNNSKYDQVWVQ